MHFARRFAPLSATTIPWKCASQTPTQTSPSSRLLWHRILHKKGWIAPSWPTEFGDTGWNITQRYIWEQEAAAANTFPPLPFGLTMVGPVIYTFETARQRERYLSPILSGDHWWCQGYSEPGAGSDLASLRTRAVRDGYHYIVNGHKTWTTLAQHADWTFCLVRTNPDAKLQQGISFLLIDMRSPGVSVRLIITIDGVHEVNDVFLDDVRVRWRTASARKTEAGTTRNSCSATSARAWRGRHALAAGSSN